MVYLLVLVSVRLSERFCVLFIVITAVGLRQAIIRAIPEAIRIAITPGIGLFITIIGLKNAGIVVSNPATLVSMVDFAQWRSGENTELICGGNIWKIKHLL